MAASDRQIFDWIVQSVGYDRTVGPTDKSKVTRAINGIKVVTPSAKLAKAAYELAKRINPPAPPVQTLAPQTYNKGSAGQDARYCTAQSGNPDGGGYHYDSGGRSLGGRSGNPVAGLKPADEMDSREPCDPYNGFPPWPPDSYKV